MNLIVPLLLYLTMLYKRLTLNRNRSSVKCIWTETFSISCIFSKSELTQYNVPVNFENNPATSTHLLPFLCNAWISSADFIWYMYIKITHAWKSVQGLLTPTPLLSTDNTQTFQMQSYFHKTEGIRPIYITLIKYSAPVICGYPLYSKSKRHLEIVFALVILDMN